MASAYSTGTSDAEMRCREVRWKARTAQVEKPSMMVAENVAYCGPVVRLVTIISRP
jgi:hypothetical protein